MAAVKARTRNASTGDEGARSSALRCAHIATSVAAVATVVARDQRSHVTAVSMPVVFHEHGLCGRWRCTALAHGRLIGGVSTERYKFSERGTEAGGFGPSAMSALPTPCSPKDSLDAGASLRHGADQEFQTLVDDHVAGQGRAVEASTIQEIAGERSYVSPVLGRDDVDDPGGWTSWSRDRSCIPRDRRAPRRGRSRSCH